MSLTIEKETITEEQANKFFSDMLGGETIHNDLLDRLKISKRDLDCHPTELIMIGDSKSCYTAEAIKKNLDALGISF